ncbi:energy-coupling factor transporter transmembrane component T family protein [Texcoconibacillus texcoconensis]|uniref:Energy-coupling factor transporter transmembrane protein EcfT n=1 Tax=Texcoconibacillus texcoconensis TaxID=1095777 RepID=A0A840QUA9_9BACI|nr:energy-coupling factor transporter transmembrane component T [Texcoconibacillus texcoconensis]MBB5174954.1 energy-coupling factor transport system permease protein [Texcoconibacillus texcoconensis]
MFKNIIIGQYIPGTSMIHGMDPRAKLIVVFVFIINLFIANQFVSFSLLTLYVLGAFFLSKVPIRFFLKGLRLIAIIIVVTFLLHLFMTREGEPLFSVGFLTVYEGGVKQGAMISLRLFLLVVMTSMLTLTTTPIALTDGLESLFNPLKKFGVPVYEFALMMSISLRFIPTLLMETEKIMKAQMARGANFLHGSLVKRVKAFVPVLVPLFIQAFKRADELATAMESRGYQGGAERTRFRQQNWRGLDTFVLLTVVALMFIVLALRWLS